MLLSKSKSKSHGFSAICQCDICGKKFKRKYHRVIRAKKQYCSVECRKKRIISEETKEKLRLWNLKGGRSKNQYGYILIYRPEHPLKNHAGYIFEHRLIMEKYLGRYLTKDEVVHHINKNVEDNRIENLMLFECNGKHQKYHLELKKK